MGEDTDRNRDVLVRPEWPGLRKRVWVERWEHLHTILIVCYTNIKICIIQKSMCYITFILVYHKWFLSCCRYWMNGQPDNWGDEPGEDCVQVVGESQGRWSDKNCNVKRKYICKHVNRKSTVCTVLDLKRVETVELKPLVLSYIYISEQFLLFLVTTLQDTQIFYLRQRSNTATRCRNTLLQIKICNQMSPK